MATVRDLRAKGSAQAVIRTRVDQFALLAVGDLLTPTPTSGHWQALGVAMRDGTPYRVDLDEDELLNHDRRVRRTA